MSRDFLLLGAVVLLAIVVLFNQWRSSRVFAAGVEKLSSSSPGKPAGKNEEPAPRYVRHTADDSETVYRVVGEGPVKGFLRVVDGTDGGPVQFFAKSQTVEVMGFDPMANKIAKEVAGASLKRFKGPAAQDDEGEVAPPPALARPEDGGVVSGVVVDKRAEEESSAKERA